MEINLEMNWKRTNEKNILMTIYKMLCSIFTSLLLTTMYDFFCAYLFTTLSKIIIGVYYIFSHMKSIK